MTYPNNIESKIDFTVIREELGRRCASPLGRERVEAMQMETSFEVVQHLLLLTDQMRMAKSDPILTFPRGDIFDSMLFGYVILKYGNPEWLLPRVLH